MLVTLAIGALAVAALLALALIHRVPRNRERPMIALAVLLALEVPSVIAQLDLGTALRGLPLPYEGRERGLYHVTQALFMAWPAGVAALAVLVLMRRAPVAVGVFLALEVAWVCWAYPDLRGDDLETVYRIWEATWIAVGLASIVSFARARRAPLPEHVCAIVLVGGEIVVLAGTFELGIFAHWPTAQAVYIVTFGAVAALLSRHLWILTRSWRTSSV